MYQLWTTRYRTLMEQGLLPDGVHNTAEEGVLCENMNEKNSKAELESATTALEESGLQTFVQSATANVERLPDDTWELWTGNYVEYIATTAVEVDLVGAFLRHYGSCIFH